MLRLALYGHSGCSVGKLLFGRPEGKWRPTREREEEGEREEPAGPCYGEQVQ